MTPKEYLNQIRRLDEKINHAIIELDELKNLITSISGVDYSKDKNSKPSSGEPSYVKLYDKIETLDVKINKQIDEYVDKRAAIIAQIEGMEEATQAEILYKRYVEFKRLELIACEMNFSYDWIKHMHGRALQTFGKKYCIS